MAESKTYQLAKRCRGAMARTQPHLRSLPCYIGEEDNVPEGHLEIEDVNIFNQTGLVKEKRMDFNQDASYRYVGVKELRAYQTRTDKKKRNLNSFNLRVSESAVSFSRVSAVKAPQTAFLTKQEIIKKMSLSRTASTDKEEQIYLKEKNSLMTTGCFESTMTSFKGKESKDSSATPSLSKIKNLRRKYENQWNVAIQSRNIVKRESIGHKKYRSVLENVSIFREKVEERERHGLLERAMNIQASDWQLTLHNGKSLKTIHERQEVRISKEMKATGNQKYRKELAWVQQKDQEGCFFKLLPNKSNLNA